MHQRYIAIFDRLDETLIHDLHSLYFAIGFVVHLERDLSESPRTFDSSTRFSTITRVVVLTNSPKVRELTQFLNTREPNTLGEPDFVLEMETRLFLHLTLDSYYVLEGLIHLLKEGLRLPIRIVILRVVESTDPDLR